MKIQVTLTFQTPVNIGSGTQVGTFADRALIKDAAGRPYIPASTLKGRLRHALEQLVSGLGKPVCQSVSPSVLCKTNPCPVCALLGSPWIESKLNFENLALGGPPMLIDELNQQSRPLRTKTRTGVALARKRKVAADQFLYTTELFQPGLPLQFRGEIRGSMAIVQAGLIVAGLRFIPALGAGKTGGLGWLQIEASVEKQSEESAAPGSSGASWVPVSLATLQEALDQWR